MTIPRLSVLMTTYNSERFLSEVFESILSQTFTDFEFIVVDDGSRDGSASLIRSFCGRDSRVRGIFLPKNVGISRAANIGLREVRAALVARVDSDDLCAPDRFARQVVYMDKHLDIYMLGCRTVNIDELGNKIEDDDCSKTEGVGNYRISFVIGRRQIAIRMGDGDYPLVHATLMYRTSTVLALGGYRELFPVGEDLDLYERMFVRYGCVFANLPNVLYFYRRISGSITSQYNLKKHQYIGIMINHSSYCFRHDLANPLDAVKHMSFPPVSSSKAEFIIMELVFYLHIYRNLLYKPLPHPKNLRTAAKDLRRFSMIMSKLSLLPKGSKTREFLYRRVFLLLLLAVPFAKDKREDFLRSFDDAIFHRDDFLNNSNYSNSCVIVARSCLSFGERNNFIRYMFMAFRIDFIYTLRFIFVRTLAHLIK